MRILLDTHVFLWAITNDRRLSAKYRRRFQDPASDLFLSVVGCWEVLIKSNLGKLTLPLPASRFLTRQMELNRVALLGIRPAHFDELEKLPALHRDPFDRMMIAQARAESMSIMTVDKALRPYGVPIL